MITEILLVIIFLSSAGIFLYLLSQKLPELIAIPEQVITERFHEESARFRLFLLHFKSFLKEDHYKPFLAGSIAKFLHRLHIILMRTDNTVVGWHRHFREGVRSADLGDARVPIQSDPLLVAAQVDEGMHIPECEPAPKEPAVAHVVEAEVLPIQHQSASYGDAALRVKAIKRPLQDSESISFSTSMQKNTGHQPHGFLKETERVLHIDRKPEATHLDALRKIQRDNFLQGQTTSHAVIKEKQKSGIQKIAEEEAMGARRMRLRKSKIVVPEPGMER